MFDDEWQPQNSDMSLADQYASYGEGKASLDNTGLSDSDFMEAIGMALGESASQPWVQQSMGAYTSPGQADQNIANAPKAVVDTAKSEKGIIGRMSDWVGKNKGLTEILAKGVAGAAAASSNKKASEVAARSRLDELKLKNQQEMEKDTRVSASVSGLRAPTGLIGRAQQQLRRADGTPVYQNGRIV